jgi:hypothetical protein
MRFPLSALCVAGALSCTSITAATAQSGAAPGATPAPTTAQQILAGGTTLDYTQWRGRHGWRGGHRGYGRYGGYRGRYYGRRGHYGGRGAAIGAGVAGLAAGALIGGAIASQAAPVAVGPGPDAVSYCAQRFKSYDPASGTYLGYDGNRHACP